MTYATDEKCHNAHKVAWSNPRDRYELEAALDSHRLYVAMVYGRWWQARRNGKTQLWKRDPTRWRIPFKVGFRTCGAATNHSNMRNFRIADSREAAESGHENVTGLDKAGQ